MFYQSDFSILAFIFSAVVLVTFFVMANRLKRIRYAVEALVELEKRKSDKYKLLQCPKCKHEFTVEINKQGQMNCPQCKEIVTI